MIEEIQKEVRHTIAPLISDIFNDSQELLEKEIELAKTEIRHEVNQATNYAMTLFGSIIAFMFGLLLFSFTLAYLLIDVYPAIPLWKSFGLVTLFLGLVSGILYARAMSLKKKINIVPEKTVQTIKEVFNG